ncbi:hypothetical protein DFH11DRAFT_49496 [Phellopilus nigrolimitatus]|nr:hypothetical protein DFH11DRAFT_49496 [Phellopilus nigrolimitatus]
MNVHAYTLDSRNVREMNAAQLTRLSNQALALNNSGDYAGAEKLHQQVLSVKKQSSIQAALSWNALGEVQLKLCKLNEAEDSLRKAVDIRNKDQFDGLDAAVSRENLAQARGKPKDANEIRLSGAPKAFVCGHENCPGQLFSLEQLFLCSKCKSIFYCSKGCQEKDRISRHMPEILQN